MFLKHVIQCPWCSCSAVPCVIACVQVSVKKERMLLSAHLLQITSLIIDNCSLMALLVCRQDCAAVLRDDTARWFSYF